jgi:hypothetical protein
MNPKTLYHKFPIFAVYVPCSEVTESLNNNYSVQLHNNNYSVQLHIVPMCKESLQNCVALIDLLPFESVIVFSLLASR